MTFQANISLSKIHPNLLTCLVKTSLQLIMAEQQIYRFSITMPDDEAFERIIDIPGDYTFEALHLAVLSAVNFDDAQLASFYVSDASWQKGEEITLMDMGDENAPATMESLRLADKLTQPEARLVYVYDFILMWTFYLELIAIAAPNPNWEYPMLVEEAGTSPDQYGEQSHYPEALSDEDQELIEQLKQQGLNLGRDSDDSQDDETGTEPYDDDNLYT